MSKPDNNLRRAEIWRRQEAVRLVSHLPDNVTDARAILALAQHLVDCFLDPGGCLPGDRLRLVSKCGEKSD